jgi:cytochrome oxidase Cu insertion factor (SCO1/SenC/PrrC family)
MRTEFHCVMAGKRFSRLTGAAKVLLSTAMRAQRYGRRLLPSSKGDDYTVDHSAFIYLMGADGHYLGFFPPGTGADRIAETIRAQLAAAH